MNIDTNNMILIKNTQKTKNEIPEFVELAKEARTFLLNHKWCKEIKSQWLAENWENMVMVFYFNIVPNSLNADDFVWVIVGDIPPAYIDIESAKNAREVVQIYTNLMNDWVQHVKNKKSVENCYPINVPPENEYAEMLGVRVGLIKEHILS